MMSGAVPFQANLPSYRLAKQRAFQAHCPKATAEGGGSLLYSFSPKLLTTPLLQLDYFTCHALLSAWHAAPGKIATLQIIKHLYKGQNKVLSLPVNEAIITSVQKVSQNANLYLSV